MLFLKLGNNNLILYSCKKYDWFDWNEMLMVKFLGIVNVDLILFEVVEK